VHPDLIESLLSIKIGNAAEQLSVPELCLILTGNQQSDIAGQFNNFASSENISDILTIIGQFSSVSGLRKQTRYLCRRKRGPELLGHKLLI
jgi:hypothetical protein